MPVEDHATHPMVVNTGQPYGCHNRPDFEQIAYGAAVYGSQSWGFKNSHDCRFDLSDTDPRCAGCWRIGQGANYAAGVIKNVNL